MYTTRDATTGIRIRYIRIGTFEVPGILVKLSGELDVQSLHPLQRTFDDSLTSGLPTYVDLSGVTFLDVRCARELAVQDRRYLIYGNLLAFRNPSWQAEASFKACGLEYLIEPGYQDGEQFYVTEAWEDSEEKNSETLALGV